jgi:hypothetical protein
VWLEDPADLAHQEIGISEVFDQLVRVDEIEAGIWKRDALFDIRAGHVDASFARDACVLLEELDSLRLGRPDVVGDASREGALMRSEVEHPAAGASGQGLQDRPTVLLLGRPEDAREIASPGWPGGRCRFLEEYGLRMRDRREARSLGPKRRLTKRA